MTINQVSKNSKGRHKFQRPNCRVRYFGTATDPTETCTAWSPQWNVLLWPLLNCIVCFLFSALQWALCSLISWMGYWSFRWHNPYWLPKIPGLRVGGDRRTIIGLSRVVLFLRCHNHEKNHSKLRSGIWCAAYHWSTAGILRCVLFFAAVVFFLIFLIARPLPALLSGVYEYFALLRPMLFELFDTFISTFGHMTSHLESGSEYP